MEYIAFLIPFIIVLCVLLIVTVRVCKSISGFIKGTKKESKGLKYDFLLLVMIYETLGMSFVFALTMLLQIFTGKPFLSQGSVGEIQYIFIAVLLISTIVLAHKIVSLIMEYVAEKNTELLLSSGSEEKEIIRNIIESPFSAECRKKLINHIIDTFSFDTDKLRKELRQ